MKTYVENARVFLSFVTMLVLSVVLATSSDLLQMIDMSDWILLFIKKISNLTSNSYTSFNLVKLVMN